MDAKRKKELLLEFKNRKAEMGIVSFHCVPTGDHFIMGSKDTKADLNSNRFQLEMGNNYNRALQTLWNQHGSAAFTIGVLEVLPYDEKEENKDYTADLEALCCCYLESNTKMKRLKR